MLTLSQSDFSVCATVANLNLHVCELVEFFIAFFILQSERNMEKPSLFFIGVRNLVAFLKSFTYHSAKGCVKRNLILLRQFQPRIYMQWTHVIKYTGTQFV